MVAPLLPPTPPIMELMVLVAAVVDHMVVETQEVVELEL
jgi:hypothetical protein